MKRLVSAITITMLCAGLSACIVLDAADLGYMATHHGRHIDEAPVSASGGDMAAGSIGGMLGGMGPSGGKKNANAGPMNVGALLGGLGPTGGKSVGAGTAALTSPTVGGLLGDQAAAPSTVGALLGDQVTPEAPVGKFMGDQFNLRPPATRPGLTEGTVPGYGPDSPASGGQIVSSLGLASSITNPASLIGGAATEDDTNRTLIGRQWDKTFGGKPGTPVDTRNPIANNTNARGDVRQGDDTRLADRAGAAATAALLGDGPDSGAAGTDALFSDVQLADRRKRSDFAGTNMLLKAA